MKASDIIADLANSSWLRYCTIIEDSELGYLLSLNPDRFNIVRDNNDMVRVVEDGDNLTNLSYRYYDTDNYAPLLYLLNDTIEHPLVLEPGTEIWLPHPTKIYNFLRDLNLTE